MKTLLVTRHAKSSWNTDVSSDFQRPLNKRGKADAPIMAKRLAARGLLPQMIVASTAARTIATTELMMPELGITTDSLLTTDNIYEAPLSALEKTVCALPQHIEVAMLVGHNPGVSMLCNFLCQQADLQMPTCAMACLELNIDSWEECYKDCGTLLWYDYPKNQM